MSPRRILLATDAFPPVCGGSGWSTYELARGLRQLGHDVLVVQPRPGERAGMRESAYDGIPLIEIGSYAPGLPFLRNYFKNERLHAALGAQLGKLARSRHIDVLHGQHVLTAPAAVWAGTRAGLPVVCTVRDYWPVCYWSDLIHDREADSLCPGCSASMMTRCVRPRAGGAWPLALPLIPYMRGNLARKRSALSRADALIAVSSAIARDLRSRAPELSRTRLETIPNPVDVEAIAAAALANRPPAHGPYAVYAGKIEPNKGVQHLVPALAAAKLPWRTVLVGDGSQRAAIEAEAARAGVSLSVLGWLPRAEALGWIAGATLLVFPSHGPESLSRVLLEAASLGVPIAAMDTGGTSDIIVHEQTGLLSPTAAQLATDVTRLAADEALRARLGAGARAHVESRFSSRRVVTRVADLYESLLALRGDRRG
jgi:glycosyltransferase involved in cell wall biosynthesis